MQCGMPPFLSNLHSNTDISLIGIRSKNQISRGPWNAAPTLLPTSTLTAASNDTMTTPAHLPSCAWSVITCSYSFIEVRTLLNHFSSLQRTHEGAIYKYNPIRRVGVFLPFFPFMDFRLSSKLCWVVSGVVNVLMRKLSSSFGLFQ